MIFASFCRYMIYRSTINVFQVLGAIQSTSNPDFPTEKCDISMFLIKSRFRYHRPGLFNYRRSQLFIYKTYRAVSPFISHNQLHYQWGKQEVCRCVQSKIYVSVFPINQETIYLLGVIVWPGICGLIDGSSLIDGHLVQLNRGFEGGSQPIILSSLLYLYFEFVAFMGL